MREEHIGRTSVKAGTDWNRLSRLTDSQIRRAVKTDPDASLTDASFWEGARVVMPKAKQAITIRLDADLLEWFRGQERYQTRINAVLRTYMNANLSSPRLSGR
jgi:uncharacterized protein (DUF4415 family)